MKYYKKWMAAVLCCGMYLYAQEKDSAVIVVTGNKVEQAAEEAVDKVTVVSEEKIAEMGAKNVAEVLQNLPGITVTEHPMEGVSMQGFSGAYVKVLIDGVAVGGDVGGASPIALIPSSDIDHIEIIKGASSALYGSDAMGGVINIITKKNRSSWSLSTKQEIDIHKHYFGMAGFSYKNKLFGINGIGSFDNMPGMITREFDPLGRKIDTFIFPKTRMGFGRLSTDFYLPTGTMQLYGTYTNHDRYMNQAEDIANRFTSEKGEAGFKGAFDFGESAQMNVFSSYKYFKHFFDEIYTAYTDDNIKRRYSTFHEVETEVNANYDFSIAHSLLAGMNIKWAMMQGIDFPKPKHSALFGIFTQYVWNMKGEDVLRIVPGLRFDLAPPMLKGDRTLWQLTPKLSIRYDPLDVLTMRFSYGMGFKVPTLKQKYWLFFHPAPVNFVLLGNPLLKPEYSQGFNASLEYRPVEGLRFGASGYFNYVNNLIFAVETDKREGYFPDSNGNLHAVTGLREYLNIDRVMTVGGDFSIQYNWKWIETGVTYTIAGMYNYDTDNKRYYRGAYFVPHQIKFNLTGIIPKSLTRITLGLHWDSPQNIRDGFDIRAADKIKLTDEKYITSPDKLLVNLHISQKLWQDRIELYAGIKNMLNNISFAKGSDGRSMKDFYGLKEGIIGYFGIGIKYDAVPQKNEQKLPHSTDEAERPGMDMPGGAGMR
ncbi:TonB-dependent receptor [Treponema phagedenis]|uniref:TonB-dependent receptor n=1 Tax=Treponema phagedenis TaxID=162 RepID=A0A0B7H0L8_TREPH|nr:TonB-dependent receptor [Treponema phagedenis]NVP24184.1 TonB-dependent receptor [Treponema phagedenis]QEJ96155.1 TonB-dependent receptor [Treponema phagedenis]QEJ99257.1 TonB-dependent receptor [Treponema phagedenis]QEK00115.1 TonB-dependent receptor [Treponema phagedenis]QEK04824.1 TonB-dependent receptor [Treponema phagedenis]